MKRLILETKSKELINTYLRIVETILPSQENVKQRLKYYDANVTVKEFVLCITLAGAAGFEPANDGIKSRCLTTWRRPNNLREGGSIAAETAMAIASVEPFDPMVRVWR